MHRNLGFAECKPAHWLCLPHCPADYPNACALLQLDHCREDRHPLAFSPHRAICVDEFRGIRAGRLCPKPYGPQAR